MKCAYCGKEIDLDSSYCPRCGKEIQLVAEPVFEEDLLRNLLEEEADHTASEKKEQEHDRARRDAVPEGECQYFDEAYERGMKLLNLDLAELDVNMFSAVNNSLINDGCGLYRGRLILPYEHLSRFQNDLID